MKIIAIVPARGASTRIPRKNIVDLCGKPMISWTIEAALEANCFDKILVSTEDAEIAEIAKNNGAEVPFLRSSRFDNVSPISEATSLAVTQAESFWGENYDVVVQLMANCPIRDCQDIRSSLSNFKVNNFIAQISCFKFGFMNPWWSATLDLSNKPQYLFPESRIQRSQDLPNLYCPSGAVWIALVEDLKKYNTFYSPDHIFFPLNWISALDIDDYDDLEMAKILLTYKNHKNSA